MYGFLLYAMYLLHVMDKYMFSQLILSLNFICMFFFLIPGKGMLCISSAEIISMCHHMGLDILAF